MPVYSETEQVGDADDGADVREVPMSDMIHGTTESTTSPMWDVSDAAFRAEPYPFYDRLRTADPVHVTETGAVVLTRYDDVLNTLRSNDFSRDIVASATGRDDPVSMRRAKRARSGSKSILNLDPPDHTRLRRLVSKAFTPTAIERLRGSIGQLVDQSLDRAADAGEMELVEELAFPVPFQVISNLLDIPDDRESEVREWSSALTASLEPTATLDDLDAAEAASAQLAPYLLEIVDERRRHLGDDVLSGLIAVEEEGDRLTLAELLTFVVLLYVAGHETTVNLIGNGTYALLRNPDQLDLWRGDPSLDASAIDELLRFDGPVQQTARVPTVPVEYTVDGRTIVVEPGTFVNPWLGAANHDPAVFADPGRLDLRRTNCNRHVAFSAGIHYCLGASLARLEATIAITRLIRRFPRLELVSEPVYRDRVTIRGIDEMRLVTR